MELIDEYIFTTTSDSAYPPRSLGIARYFGLVVPRHVEVTVTVPGTGSTHRTKTQSAEYVVDKRCVRDL
jgi:hypothetical protein